MSNTYIKKDKRIRQIKIKDRETYDWRKVKTDKHKCTDRKTGRWGRCTDGQKVEIDTKRFIKMERLVTKRWTNS
jgi:hypothetical protein